MTDKNHNSGNCNSGRWNSGNYNSGDCNSGNCNSGRWNSGNYNSGDCNSGFYNSGHCNSGRWNSGNYNSGHCNSGNCNSGRCNSGFFNTDEPNIRMFNKPTDKKRRDINIPDFCYIALTKWVRADDMTDTEKQEHPSYETTGGYLQTYDYKEAWRMSWDNADEEDRKAILDLPNFDADIFLEITGIDVRVEFAEKVEPSCDGKVVGEVGKILGGAVTGFGIALFRSWQKKRKQLRTKAARIRAANRRAGK